MHRHKRIACPPPPLEELYFHVLFRVRQNNSKHLLKKGLFHKTCANMTPKVPLPGPQKETQIHQKSSKNRPWSPPPKDRKSTEISTKFVKKCGIFEREGQKHVCVFSLWPLLGGPWESIFYAFLRCSRPIDSHSVSIGSASFCGVPGHFAHEA